jgi:predicted AAA+ superfamily ATPase
MNFNKYMELMYSVCMFTRAYEPIETQHQPNKALVIYGPRRVGKTILLQTFLQQTRWKYKLDSGDNIRTQQILS